MSQHNEVDDSANDISAKRILEAIAACFADCDQTPQTLIRYAVCDLRHLCDVEGLDFAACDRLGYELYLEEKPGVGR